MDRLKAAWEFFEGHRAKWGAALIAIGTLLAAWGPEYAHGSQVTLLVGGILTGGGALQADAAVRARQEWERSRVERRQSPQS